MSISDVTRDVTPSSTRTNTKELAASSDSRPEGDLITLLPELIARLNELKANGIPYWNAGIPGTVAFRFGSWPHHLLVQVLQPGATNRGALAEYVSYAPTPAGKNWLEASYQVGCSIAV